MIAGSPLIASVGARLARYLLPSWDIDILKELWADTEASSIVVSEDVIAEYAQALTDAALADPHFRERVQSLIHAYLSSLLDRTNRVQVPSSVK